MMLRLIIAGVLLAGLWISAVTLAGSTVERMIAREIVPETPRESAVWQQSVARLTQISQLDPWHPGVLDRLAELQPERDALATRRQLVEISPRVARYWVDLFVLKTRLQEWDDEARQALAEAVRLGPYEPVVNEKIIRQAMAAWPLLDQPARRMVIEASARGLQSSAHFRRDAVWRLVRRSGLLPLTCQVEGASTHPLCDP